MPIAVSNIQRCGISYVIKQARLCGFAKMLEILLESEKK